MKQRYTKCHHALVAVLRESREKAGISQRALSLALKRPVNFVHLVESAERTLSVCEFIEYADAIGVDATKLLGRVRARARLHGHRSR